jgi:CubicO group peptidase (beta-lactamase class C family)
MTRKALLLCGILVSFALTASYVARIAAGRPNPGVGIIERVTVYSMMLWLAVLAVALLRRRDGTAHAAAPLTATARVDGFVAPGFEEVRAEFERNFSRRGEVGAAVAAYWRGEKVVDLWGGRRTPDGDAPWNEDTMVVVMSTTKGLSAMTLAVANARGWLDYDAPVARYWPEFAQNGKAAVTVRQLLGHEAGLVLLDEKLPVEKLADLDYVARVLARQKPAWPPGTRHGYHTMTIGLYMQELVRRVDPRHRTLGRFFHEEIAERLGLEFYIGLPREVPGERIATLKTLSRFRGLLALRYTPVAVTMKMIAPGSLLRRSFVGTNLDFRDRRSYEVEVPAGNGVGTARAIARAYSSFAEGGAELGITLGTLARLTEPPVPAVGEDVVLGVPSYFSLGFLRPGPQVRFGSSPRAFGSPGAGGSFAFADPDARVGYAYVMNKLDFYLENDPREKALRDAVYRAVARLRDHADGREGAASRQVAAASAAA